MTQLKRQLLSVAHNYLCFTHMVNHIKGHSHESKNLMVEFIDVHISNMVEQQKENISQMIVFYYLPYLSRMTRFPAALSCR